MDGLAPEFLDGRSFRMAVASAVECLDRHRDVINALNVFPVPDGDTGTNMLLTLRCGLETCNESAADELGLACESLSEGLFWGARGNSGVILSQFFKGFSVALVDKPAAGPSDLGQALARAADAAYLSVGQPVEGTMLSVMRAVSEAVNQAQSEGASEQETIWETAFASAQAALARTPDQLPVLAQAGVVDAGGMGMVAILGGICSYFTGQDPNVFDLGAEYLDLGLLNVNPDFADASHQALWGYCTQFLIEGEKLELGTIRDALGLVSESVVAIGDPHHVRVHLHALDPGPALSHAVSLGQLSQIQIENMSLQNHRWARAARAPVDQDPTREFTPGSNRESTQGSTRGFTREIARATPGVAVVAVVLGWGFQRLFKELGCAALIDGGQTMNPSVAEILEAAQGSGARDVIVLPNNENVVAAAQQAAAERAGNQETELLHLHVVPTRTVPQGVAALLAFNPEESVEHNLRAMAAAYPGLTTIEVTPAARKTSVNGVTAAPGEFIVLIDGEMALASGTADSAMLRALGEVGLTNESVVTLYWGDGSTRQDADGLAARVNQQAPGVQVDVVYGGQPYYPYLASVE